MKKYLVRYTTKGGDYEKEWTHAESAEKAAQIIRDKHWNVQSIDYVKEF